MEGTQSQTEGPRRGYRNNECKAKISVDGGRRLILQAVNPPSAAISISSAYSIWGQHEVIDLVNEHLVIFI